MARVFFSQRSLAQLRLGPLRGPLGAVHRSALRASGIVEEEEYARELTKIYPGSVTCTKTLNPRSQDRAHCSDKHCAR